METRLGRNAQAADKCTLRVTFLQQQEDSPLRSHRPLAEVSRSFLSHSMRATSHTTMRMHSGEVSSRLSRRLVAASKATITVPQDWTTETEADRRRSSTSRCQAHRLVGRRAVMEGERAVELRFSYPWDRLT